MRILKFVPLVGKFTDGQFMGGWINASPSSEPGKIEIEYFQSWFSLDSGYERGCSEEDIIRGHQSQVQFHSLPNQRPRIWI